MYIYIVRSKQKIDFYSSWDLLYSPRQLLHDVNPCNFTYTTGFINVAYDLSRSLPYIGMAACCLVLHFLLLEATCPGSTLLVHLAYQLLLRIIFILFSVAAFPVLCIRHRLIGPRQAARLPNIQLSSSASILGESEEKESVNTLNILAVYSPE